MIKNDKNKLVRLNPSFTVKQAEWLERRAKINQVSTSEELRKILDMLIYMDEKGQLNVKFY